MDWGRWVFITLNPVVFHVTAFELPLLVSASDDKVNIVSLGVPHGGGEALCPNRKLSYLESGLWVPSVLGVISPPP